MGTTGISPGNSRCQSQENQESVPETMEISPRNSENQFWEKLESVPGMVGISPRNGIWENRPAKKIMLEYRKNHLEK